MLCGFDGDSVQEAFATSNRIRRLHIQIHPALERFIGELLDHVSMGELLADYSTQRRSAGQEEPHRGPTAQASPGAWKPWAKDITSTPVAHSVVVSGTESADNVLARTGPPAGPDPGSPAGRESMPKTPVPRYLQIFRQNLEKILVNK